MSRRRSQNSGLLNANQMCLLLKRKGVVTRQNKRQNTPARVVAASRNWVNEVVMRVQGASVNRLPLRLLLMLLLLLFQVQGRREQFVPVAGRQVLPAGHARGELHARPIHIKVRTQLGQGDRLWVRKAGILQKQSRAQIDGYVLMRVSKMKHTELSA